MANQDTQKVHIFVDTNIFIEMMDLRDLDWRVMFPNVLELQIAVSLYVIEELDKLKAERQERKRRRALAALKLVDQAIGVPELVLRDTPYRVTLVVTLADVHFGDRYPSLDRTRADDRLVAHVLDHGASMLVSADRGPRLKLASLGGVALAPPDTFRLPDEESDVEKENRRLKAELKAVMDNRPRMMLKLQCASDPIVLTRSVLPPLAEDIAKEMIERVLKASPKRRPSAVWSGPLNKRHRFDWGKYQLEYSNFVKAVGAHVGTIHHRLNAIPVTLPIPFEIVNAGPVTLQNADVSIALGGPGRLFVEREDQDDEAEDHDDQFELGFPLAPMSATGFAMPRMRAIPFAKSSIPLLPGALTFEWDVIPDDDAPRRANLSNREFRVGKRQKNTICIVPQEKLPLELSLTFDLEATHLNAACQETFRVVVEQEEREWTLGDLEALIPSSPP